MNSKMGYCDKCDPKGIYEQRIELFNKMWLCNHCVMTVKYWRLMRTNARLGIEG